MSADSDFHCFHCGAAYSVRERVGRTDSCPKCDADLHCCRNCRLYAPSAHNQCSEPQAEWVRDKERSNYCDYFEPQRGARAAATIRANDARSRFNDLFKK